MWIHITFPCISLNDRCIKNYLNKSQGIDKIYKCITHNSSVQWAKFLST